MSESNKDLKQKLQTSLARLAELEKVESDRQAAVLALRDSESKYLALTENLSDIIIRFDRQFRHLYVNKAVEEIAGISKEQSLGKTHGELGYPAPIVQAIEATLQSVFDTGKPVLVQAEMPTLRGLRYFDTRIIPEFGADGQVETVISATRDITELRDAQQSLREANAMLEERVRERTHRLAEANLRLEEEVAERRRAESALRDANAELETRLKEIERLRETLEQQNVYLREEVETALAFGEIVGGSAACQAMLQQIALVAPTEAAVLIQGESGTGKELVARAIHERSGRNGQPLVKVNCGAIPRELFESEFFGHVRGAFTGAVKDRIGRFQLADGGTLFLDEVTEIPLELQSKLLRVLQEGQFERVGEDLTRSVNVRVIAATNSDLKDAVAARRFRRDLYYRLNVFPLSIPPLRERVEDIPLLAAHFTEVAAARLKCPKPRLTRGNVEQLQSYAWPGNIRELQNVIERAMIISAGGPLKLDAALGDAAATEPALVRRTATSPPAAVYTRDELKRKERENVLAALAAAGGKLYGPGGAAEILGVPATTLASRLKRFGVARPRGGGSRRSTRA